MKVYSIRMPGGAIDKVEGTKASIGPAGTLTIWSDYGYEDQPEMIRAYAADGWVRMDVQAAC